MRLSGRPNQPCNNLINHRLSTRRDFLRGDGCQGMLHRHDTGLRESVSYGVLGGGIHEDFRTQGDSGNTTIFKFDSIVHTARHAGASIPNGDHNKLATAGQFL
jgi:hypothetical protein